jgi:alanyl-tRNA synthetase
VGLLAMVTPAYVKSGYHAGNLIRQVAKELGGGGGGRPDLAQAGAKDASKLPEVLAAVPDMLRATARK